jgi:hypothetical protein
VKLGWVPARFREILAGGFVRLWPRVEISGLFVLFELRRFLYFGQNRVEAGDQLAKNASFSTGGSTAGSTASTVGALCFETQGQRNPAQFSSNLAEV